MKPNETRICPDCNNTLVYIDLNEIRDMGPGQAFICVSCKKVVYKIESKGGSKKIASVESLGILGGE